jgi:hypothetical protein
LRDLAGGIGRPARRVRRQIRRTRNSATRVLKVRIEYGQPTRSAITVAGIRGNAASNSRIRGS